MQTDLDKGQDSCNKQQTEQDETIEMMKSFFAQQPLIE
jgi:hypothetical protein